MTTSCHSNEKVKIRLDFRFEVLYFAAQSTLSMYNKDDTAMEPINDPARDLSEIRLMMERSSKILSLSGLAGIIIGIIALWGVTFAQWIHTRVSAEDIVGYLVADAIVVLALAISGAVFFSNRMAKKKGLPLWNNPARYLVTDLAIPLFAGGVFCVALLMHHTYEYLPAIMLTFYGLALVNASKFAVKEVRYLGLTQLTIGLLAALFYQEGLNFWALGFGVVHILYGLRIYVKYEK